MIIEKEIISYLRDREISGVGSNVFAVVPEVPPLVYVLIQKTGSSEENRIITDTIAVRSVSKNSLIEAAELNEAVKDALRLMPFSADVYRCALNTDYNYTLTGTKEYAYQAVFLVTHN